MTPQPAETPERKIKDKATTETDWAAAAKQVRSVSDWIVKAFLGIATLLIGTGPLLATIGDLKADQRGLIAVLAAMVALLGVGVVIWLASDINLTRVTDITELARPGPDSSTARLLARITQSPAAASMYLDNKPSVSELLQARDAEVRALADQTRSLTAQTDPRIVAEIKRYIAETRANIAAYDKVINNLQGWAGYQFIRDRFDRLRPWIFAAAACTAVGIAVWLSAVGAGAVEQKPATPMESTIASSAGPVGVLTWIKEGENAAAAMELRQQLGVGPAECDALNVVAEGGSGSAPDPWQVAILPRQVCPQVRFSVDRRLATFAGFDPAAEKKVTVTLARSWFDANGPFIVFVGFACGAVVALAARRLLTRPSET